jgi:hypothetical protein
MADHDGSSLEIRHLDVIPADPPEGRRLDAMLLADRRPGIGESVWQETWPHLLGPDDYLTSLDLLLQVGE